MSFEVCSIIVSNFTKNEYTQVSSYMLFSFLNDWMTNDSIISYTPYTYSATMPWKGAREAQLPTTFIKLSVKNEPSDSVASTVLQ